MQIKDDSVELKGLTAEAWWAAYCIDELHKEETGRELVITSGCEDIEHSVPRSAHHRGDAIDCREWHIADNEAFCARIRDRLGPDYVVINEGSHIHVHWSPIYQ